MYQAMMCLLHATLDISRQLDDVHAKQTRRKVEDIQTAMAEALAESNGRRLSGLCDEIIRLGDDVRTWLES
jgi:hypothetical protein